MLLSGRAPEAAVTLDEAPKQSPHDPLLWEALVKAQFESKDSNQAVDTAKDSMKAIPNDPRLAVGLATLCAHYGRMQTARDLLENASEGMKENTEVRLLLAKISVKAGEPVETPAVLGGVPAAAIKDPEVLSLTGVAQALLGNLDAAANNASTAARDAPNNARYGTIYAWVQQLQGHYSDAIATLMKVRTLDPEKAQIPYRIAVNYYLLDLYPQAEQSCRVAIQRDPQYSAVYRLLGIIKLEQKDDLTAQSDLQKAVASSPKKALYHRELAEAFFEDGKATEAKKQLDLALALNPKGGVAHFWRARVLSKQGNQQHSIADLLKATELKPDYLEAYIELEQLYKQAGEPRRAARGVR